MAESRPAPTASPPGDEPAVDEIDNVGKETDEWAHKVGVEARNRPFVRDRRPPGPRKPPRPKPADPLANVGVKELRKLASSRGVRGTRLMRKAELLAALRLEEVA